MADFRSKSAIDRFDCGSEMHSVNYVDECPYLLHFLQSASYRNGISTEIGWG